MCVCVCGVCGVCVLCGVCVCVVCACVCCVSMCACVWCVWCVFVCGVCGVYVCVCVCGVCVCAVCLCVRVCVCVCVCVWAVLYKTLVMLQGGRCIWEDILKLILRGGNKSTFSSCLTENVVAIKRQNVERCLGEQWLSIMVVTWDGRIQVWRERDGFSANFGGIEV